MSYGNSRTLREIKRAYGLHFCFSGSRPSRGDQPSSKKRSIKPGVQISVPIHAQTRTIFLMLTAFCSYFVGFFLSSPAFLAPSGHLPLFGAASDEPLTEARTLSRIVTRSSSQALHTNCSLQPSCFSRASRGVRSRGFDLISLLQANAASRFFNKVQIGGWFGHGIFSRTCQ